MAIVSAPDGTSFAAGTPDGEVRLFDAGSDHAIATLRGHVGAVLAAAYSPDSRLVASGGRDGVVCLWDVRGRRLLGMLPASREPIAAVQFSPDGRILAVASGDAGEASGSSSASGAVTLWDVDGRRELGPLSGHERAASSITFSPDGRTVAASGPDGSSGCGTSPPAGRGAR